MKSNKFLSFFLICCILLGFTNCKSTTESTTAVNVTTADYFHQPNKIFISAHRGGANLKGYPENSLETIDYLYNQGINVFEIDINQTKEGQLMLFHDDFLEKHSTGTGKFSKESGPDIKAFQLKDNFGNITNFHPPYLNEVLEWAKDKEVYFMVDFKKNTSYEKTIKEIKASGLKDHCVLISYSPEQAEKLHKLAPDMLLSVSARNMEELERMLATSIPTELMIAFTGTRLSEEELYERLDQKGIPAILGSLGNLDKRAEAKGDHLYKNWAQLGINIFATDRPLEVLKAIQ